MGGVWGEVFGDAYAGGGEGFIAGSRGMEFALVGDGVGVPGSHYSC